MRTFLIALICAAVIAVAGVAAAESDPPASEAGVGVPEPGVERVVVDAPAPLPPLDTHHPSAVEVTTTTQVLIDGQDCTEIARQNANSYETTAALDDELRAAGMDEPQIAEIVAGAWALHNEGVDADNAAGCGPFAHGP